jgi:hypothetical protein
MRPCTRSGRPSMFGAEPSRRGRTIVASNDDRAVQFVRDGQIPVRQVGSARSIISLTSLGTVTGSSEENTTCNDTAVPQIARSTTHRQAIEER